MGLTRVSTCPDIDRAYIKDPSGLLTPERARTLIPAVKAHLGGKALELHSHCTLGLSSISYMTAAELGVEVDAPAAVLAGALALALGAKDAIFNRLVRANEDIARHHGHGGIMFVNRWRSRLARWNGRLFLVNLGVKPVNFYPFNYFFLLCLFQGKQHLHQKCRRIAGTRQDDGCPFRFRFPVAGSQTKPGHSRALDAVQFAGDFGCDHHSHGLGRLNRPTEGVGIFGIQGSQ